MRNGRCVRCARTESRHFAKACFALGGVCEASTRAHGSGEERIFVGHVHRAISVFRLFREMVGKTVWRDTGRGGMLATRVMRAFGGALDRMSGRLYKCCRQTVCLFVCAGIEELQREPIYPIISTQCIVGLDAKRKLACQKRMLQAPTSLFAQTPTGKVFFWARKENPALCAGLFITRCWFSWVELLT